MSWLDSSPVANVSDAAIHDPWRVRLLSRGHFQELGSVGHLCRNQLRYLAWFGSLAPSTHNTVPQRFRLRPEAQSIDVLADRKYVLAESDPTGRQCLVSLGCTLANIKTAAKVFGLSARVTFAPLGKGQVTVLQEAEGDAERYRMAFSVTFGADDEGADACWLALMRSRKVLRAEYDRAVELGPGLESRLQEIVAASQGEPSELQLHLIKAPLVLKALGKFQEQADRFVLENRRFASELGQWLLPNSEDSSRRGMRGQEFGFDDAFSEHVHHALQGRQQLLPDQLAAFAKGGKVGLETSSAVAVISVSADEPVPQLSAGCAAQLLALEASRHGFHSAYHAALTEVDWARAMFAASILHTRRRPMVILRLGKPKRASDLARPHAARPGIDDLLID